MQNIQLSPHFSLREMTQSRTAQKHGIVNVPSELEVENLRRLCEGCLEPLREKMGLPIVITSGYRCQRLNEILVHAARKSQHMSGQAADFYVAQGPVSGSKIQVSGDLNHETGASPMKLETPRQRLVRAFRLIILEESIDFDQLILYPSFIHVSYVSRERNRRKLTRAFAKGSYAALSRSQALSIN